MTWKVNKERYTVTVTSPTGETLSVGNTKENVCRGGYGKPQPFAAELPVFPADCPAEIKTEAMSQYKLLVTESFELRQKQVTRRITERRQALLRQLVILMRDGPATLVDGYPWKSNLQLQQPSFQNRYHYHTFDRLEFALLATGDYERENLLIVGGALTDYLRELHTLETEAQFWRLPLDPRFTAEETEAIRSSAQLRRKIFAIARRIEEGQNWMNPAAVRYDGKFETFYNVIREPWRTNWFRQREELLRRLDDAEKYMAYLIAMKPRQY